MGVVVGSLALVVFGAPNRAPETAELVRQLQQLVPDLAVLQQLSSAGGALTYRIADRSERASFVKLRTPDDRSADYLARLYRSVRLRGEDVERPYGTVQRRVEHEALVALRATNGGTNTPELLGILATNDGSAMLVTSFVHGERISDLDRVRVDRALLDRLWRQLAMLDRARIAHRNLALENVVVDTDGAVHLVDFDDAELAAGTRQRSRDVAQLLVETAILVGVDEAVEAAIDGIGVERVAAAIPLLQPLALPAPMRRRMKTGELSLDELRTRALARSGADDVPLERLERVRPRTLLTIVALTAAFYFLLPQLANIGDTVDTFGDAEWQWMIVAIIGSVLTYVFAAVSFVGSVAERVPFAPALRSRVASSFASSITPAGAGGMAIGVRVLQRTGIDPAAATASVGINLVAGVLVHVGLLFAFIAWTGRSGLGGFSLPSSTVLLLGLAVVLGVAGLALAIKKIRDFVLQPVMKAARAAAGRDRGRPAQPGSSRLTARRCHGYHPLVRAGAGGLHRSVRRRTRGSADRRRVSRCITHRQRRTDTGRSRRDRSRLGRRAHWFRPRRRRGRVGGADISTRDVLAPDSAGLVHVPLDAEP